MADFDGTNGSQALFPEQSPATNGNISFVGNAQLSTANPKFGTASLLLDGVGDSCRIVDDADWDFGSGAFTIDIWAYFSDATFISSNAQTLISRWQSSGNQRGWQLRTRGDLGTKTLEFNYTTDGTAGTSAIVSGTWTPTINTWYHIAVDRGGNVFRTYVDGVMLAKVTAAVTIFDASGTLRIGAVDSSGTDVLFLKGNLDDIRITKGVARYASDSGYTVPTAAFPHS